MIVVDASVVLKWFFPEDGTEEARSWVDRAVPLIAPDLIVPEVGNAVWRKQRQGEAAPEMVSSIMRETPNLLSKIVPTVEFGQDAAALAVSIDHPIYDCFYLTLAEEYDTLVLTADRRFISKLEGTRWANRIQRLVA